MSGSTAAMRSGSNQTSKEVEVPPPSGGGATPVVPSMLNRGTLPPGGQGSSPMFTRPQTSGSVSTRMGRGGLSSNRQSANTASPFRSQTPTRTATSTTGQQALVPKSTPTPSIKPTTASYNVFTRPQVQVLAQAAKDIASFLNQAEAKGVVLFIGDSPSWIYHTLIALGLHKGRAWHPVQLPITGALVESYHVQPPKPLWETTPARSAENEPTKLESYRQNVLKTIWLDGKIPAWTYVVDRTLPEPGKVFSSVDMVQQLFRVIVKHQTQQSSTVPNFKLVWQIGKGNEISTVGLPKRFPAWTSVAARIVIPDWPEGERARDMPFETRLANGYYPRGCVRYPISGWDQDYTKLKQQLEAGPGFKACMNAIRLYIQSNKA